MMDTARSSVNRNTTKVTLIETNNNFSETADNLKKISLSRRSSEGSGLGGRNGKGGNRFEKQRSLQEISPENDQDNKISWFRRGRSNSDGAAISLPDNAEAFPSLPNAVLEKLGLHGDITKERINEESLEQKFTSLALAFSIDSTTINDRRERQRRSRDQTESNFNLEVDKLKEKLTLLQPLCTDFESAELLSTLFSQVEILTKAASLVSIAAERYGAVQHEERLAESVHLMVNHVQALKQQRDSARRQLQYTKRVLQEPAKSASLSPNREKSFGVLNKKLIGKRRASTDSVNFSEPQSEQVFKMNRRTADLSFRASLVKNRPTRLDLGMELNKIKEISTDDGMKDETPLILETPTSEVEANHFPGHFENFNKTQLLQSNEMQECNNKFDDISTFLRLKFSSYREEVQRKLAEMFKKCSEYGYLHAFLNSCAVLCFSISVLTLVSIFLEQGYTKASIYWLFPWLNRNK